MAKRSWRPYQSYSPARYTRVGIESLSDAELAAEYSKIRREVKERLRSFSRSRSADVREIGAQRERQMNLPTRAELRAQGDPRGLMEDLILESYRFVSARTSTVAGYEATHRKQLNALQARGLDIVSERDLSSFGKFMDYARSRKRAKFKASDPKAGTISSSAAAYDQAMRQGISRSELQRHYQFYIDQIDGGSQSLVKWTPEEGARWRKEKNQQKQSKK